MRVISMVPSWTEMLIECGVDVVGLTRFCVHPAGGVKKVTAVGGTKDVKWDKVRALSADLLILDKEENPKTMAEDAPIPFYATHVRSVADLPREVSAIAGLLGPSSPEAARKLAAVSARWQKVIEVKPLSIPLTEMPGVLKWLRHPGNRVDDIIYMIWRNPWMAVSRDTFIGSVFSKLGYELKAFAAPYPQINLEEFDPAKTVLLFSTEPFPFGKKTDELSELPFASALVDGEAYSWFGLRTLRFLEEALGVRPADTD